jgi:hypothetical protein
MNFPGILWYSAIAQVLKLINYRSNEKRFGPPNRSYSPFASPLPFHYRSGEIRYLHLCVEDVLKMKQMSFRPRSITRYNITTHINIDIVPRSLPFEKLPIISRSIINDEMKRSVLNENIYKNKLMMLDGIVRATPPHHGMRAAHSRQPIYYMKRRFTKKVALLVERARQERTKETKKMYRWIKTAE